MSLKVARHRLVQRGVQVQTGFPLVEAGTVISTRSEQRYVFQ